MDIDDCVDLVGAADRLVYALAEQGDGLRGSRKPVVEFREIGRRDVASPGDAPEVAALLQRFPETLGGRDRPGEKAVVERPGAATMGEKAVHQRDVSPRLQRQMQVRLVAGLGAP